MHRNLISILLIAAMATFGLSAAPARAGQIDADQWVKLFAGATVLAIIAHGAKKKDHNKGYVAAPQHPPRGYHTPPQRNHRRALPAQCVRTFHVQGQNRRLMPQRCLKRNNVKLARLPDVCYRQMNTNRGFRQGYAPRCLRRNGFAIR